MDKARTIRELRNHNRALNQFLLDGDHKRHEALLDILEHQQPEIQILNDQPAITDAVSILKYRQCKMKGSVDEQLKKALEELKGFKPLHTPVG